MRELAVLIRPATAARQRGHGTEDTVPPDATGGPRPPAASRSICPFPEEGGARVMATWGWTTGSHLPEGMRRNRLWPRHTGEVCCEEEGLFFWKQKLAGVRNRSASYALTGTTETCCAFRHFLRALDVAVHLLWPDPQVVVRCSQRKSRRQVRIGLNVFV